jgi:hypothetical protein
LARNPQPAQYMAVEGPKPKQADNRPKRHAKAQKPANPWLALPRLAALFDPSTQQNFFKGSKVPELEELALTLNPAIGTNRRAPGRLAGTTGPGRRARLRQTRVPWPQEIPLPLPCRSRGRFFSSCSARVGLRRCRHPYPVCCSQAASGKGARARRSFPAHLSPARYALINPYGKYRFKTSKGNFTAKGLRPLRQPDSTLAIADYRKA